MSILNCLMDAPNVSRHSGTMPLFDTRVSVLSSEGDGDEILTWREVGEISGCDRFDDGVLCKKYHIPLIRSKASTAVGICSNS